MSNAPNLGKLPDYCFNFSVASVLLLKLCMKTWFKKTKLILRLVLQQKGRIYWSIFQLAELALLVEILTNKFCPSAVVPACTNSAS